MDYVELAISDPSNDTRSWVRNIVVPKSDIAKIRYRMPEGSSLYRSHWAYDIALKQHVDEHRTIKGFEGVRYPDHLVFDFDLDQHQRSAFLRALEGYYDMIRFEGYDRAVLFFFSGRGFHVVLHPQLFEFSPAKDLHLYVGHAMNEYWSLHMPMLAEYRPDQAMYGSAQVYRMSNQLNAKTNLHKIAFLPGIDLQDLAIASAKNKNLISWQALSDFNKPLPADLEGLFSELIPEKIDPKQHTTVHTKSDFPQVFHCMHQLMSLGADAKDLHGGRHPIVLRMAGFMYAQSMPYEAAYAAIHQWCHKHLGEYDTLDTTQCVDSIYQGEYRFGCNDPVMSAHCDKRCLFYTQRRSRYELA